MLIGIDARMYGNKVTGIGNYVKNLTDNLFAIDQDNQYILFMLNDGYNKFTPPNERIKKIKVDCYWYTLKEQTRLFRIMEKYKTDIMHFPNFNVPLFYTGNFVVTIHDMTTRFFPGQKIRKILFRKWAYEVVFRSAILRSGNIITVSEHSKKNILHSYKVNPDKIKVVYNGISPSFQKIDNRGIINDVKAKYNITKPYIFYAGVFREHKNIPNLVKSLKVLVDKHNKDFQLILAGDLKYQDQKIDKTINELKIADRIIKTGFVPDNLMPALYSEAQITVIPSFCEGFGLIGVESLSCRTPVVASKTTSVPEILGNSALYFDPREPEEIALKINEIVGNSQKKFQLLENFSAIKTKYNWKNCAQQTLNIYNNSKK